jgi:hypothetical protein
MVEEILSRYSSRKLFVVVLIVGLTTLLALPNKLTPVVGSIFTGAVVVYPFAQGYVDGKKNDNA